MGGIFGGTTQETQYRTVLENRQTPPGQEPLYTISYTFDPRLVGYIPGLPYWGHPHDTRPGGSIKLDWTLPASQARELIKRAERDPEFMRRFIDATAHSIGPKAFTMSQDAFDDWWNNRQRHNSNVGGQPPWDQWPADRMHFFEELPQNPDGNPGAIDQAPPVQYPAEDKPHYTFDNTHRHIRSQRQT